MDLQRVLTFVVVFILMSSGISVVVQAAHDEDIVSKANIKNENNEDKILDGSNNSKKDNDSDEDFFGLNKDSFISTNDRLSSFMENLNFFKYDYLGSNKSSTEQGSPDQENNDHEEYESLYETPQNDELVNPGNRNGKTPARLNDQGPSYYEEIEKKTEPKKQKTLEPNSPKSSANGTGELILDLYDITFQENMTAISIDANFSIYRIDINGTIFTADDIRSSPDTDEIMENLTQQMSDVFNDSVSSAFPDEQKDFHSSTYNVGTSPGPVNISCYADVYLQKSSFGFDENNTELNLTDVIYGTSKMGAVISRGVDLKVNPGHNSTYRIHVPSPLITTSNDTWGIWGDSNHTFEDDKNSTATWIFNNSDGDRKVILSRNINITEQNPVDINKELVNSTSFLDMKSFENVNITNTINVSSLDITGYMKSGTGQPILPSSVSNLEIVTSDGLRMMVDNGLTSLQQIRNFTLNESMGNFEQSIENIFGEEPTLRFEWDDDTVSRYDIDTMGTNPPFRCYFNTTDPVGFTNQKLDLPKAADMDEIITETLKLDAVVNPEFNMIVEDGVYFTLRILAPENTRFENSTHQINGRYLYQEDIDNRDGDNRLTYFSLYLHWTGEVRKYYSEDVGADIDMDMISFDDVPINISMEIESMEVSRYGDKIDIPDTVNDLDYIDGNFIRVALRNDLLNLSTVYNQSVKPVRNDITANLNDLFGREVIMEFTWEPFVWKYWNTSEWEKNSSSLGAFKGYLYTPRPARFDPTSLGLSQKADLNEIVDEILMLDSELSLDFNLTVEQNRWMNLTITAPKDIGVIGGTNQSGRGRRSWYREEGHHTVNIDLNWIGTGLRDYDKENITAVGLIDIETFEDVDLNLDMSIGAVNVSTYGNQFDIPDSVNGLDYVDGDFIRVAVRNGLVDLSTIYDQSIKQSKTSMEDELNSLVGQNVSLNFTWEDQSWKNVISYRDTYPDGLGDLKAYIDLNKTVSFSPDSFDLPEGADVGGVVRSILRLNTTINKDITVNISEATYVDMTVRTPEDILIENGSRYENRWTKNYVLHEGENTVPLRLRYDGEVRDVSEEKVFVNGTLDMQNLDSIDVNVTISISSINMTDYGDNLSIPESIEGLDYVDHQFVRESVENGLLEWNNISDEMNESVDEFESKIPDLLGDIEFIYSEAGRTSGPIVRYYEAKDFKLNVTPDKEGASIDHELIEAIMNSGAVVDFEIPGVDEIDEDYTLNFKLAPPGFMNLHIESGELEKENGFYNIELREGLNGTFKSGVEGPTEETINFNMTVDLHKIKIEPSPLKLSYNVHAKSKVDAKVEIHSVELPDDIANSLPEEIKLDYATPDLIIQAEKHGLFDRQEILGMLRNGSGVDGFEGMNRTLRDALDNENIGIDISFKEGTWEYDETEKGPLVVLMDSNFRIHVAGEKKTTALDLHSVSMGSIEIPSIQGIDTNFKILFPEGIRADVRESSKVKTGWTDDDRHYVEVQTSGDSNQSVTINPDVVITEQMLFGGDVFLFDLSITLLLILIVILILLGVGFKVGRYYTSRKERTIKKSMRDSRKEEGDPDNWLEYISEEDKDRFNITRESLFELGLQEELLRQRKKAGIEDETLPSQEEEITEDGETFEEGSIEETEDEDIEEIETNEDVTEETTED